MSADLWLISDIHGCANTLLRLLAKLPQGEPVVFCGDLIDRGPHSRQVVEYAMEHDIPTVQGNHEALALFHHGRTDAGIYGQRDIWLCNGGGDALESWGLDRRKGRLPDDVLDWMAALPYYIEYGDLLVSHTGHGKAKKTKRDIFGQEEPREMLLWYRDTHFEEDGLYRVLGHSQEQQPVITEKWAMIDTGAAYPEYGVMTAFHWPSKRVVQQAFDESPL